MRRKLLSAPVLGVAAALATASVAFAAHSSNQNKPLGDNVVGRQTDGSVLNPDGQYVTPAGTVIEQSGRPMDIAVRPDGQTAVDLTKSGSKLFNVIDLTNHKVLQSYTPPSGVGSGNVGVRGLLYSADGNTLYASQVNDILKFPVNADGTLGTPTAISIPTTGAPTGRGGAKPSPLPTDMKWAPDGKNIIVVIDGYDELATLNPSTNKVTMLTKVGVGPRDVEIINNHAFVSNEGGRQPTSSDITNYSYDSQVVADPTDGRGNNGTVSEVDLATNKVVNTYQVGLDPSSLLVNGTELLVTNSSDDTVSVIDTAAQQVAQTFNVNPLPGQPFGSSPNALAFLDKTHLLVSLGRDNAIAVYEYAGAHSAPAFDGLIPTDWYPGNLVWDAPLNKLVVADQAGVGALDGTNTITEGPGTNPATGPQVYKDRGVVNLIDPPSATDIAKYTSQVFADNQWNGLADRNQKGSKNDKPVAVPTKIGAPSKIKHVFVIVQENRTYDQVLGDDPRGNGDAADAQFGQKVTPNAHAIAQQFPLIDNLYSAGTNSAVGHTWLDAGFVNDYLERSYANYVRDYGQPDALVYPKSGFLWDDAMAHGLSAHVWGEYAEWYTDSSGTNFAGTWSDWYHDSQVLEGKIKGPLNYPLGHYTTHTDVPSLQKILSPDFPNFQTRIPDQYRADLFSMDFKKYVKNNNLPNLNMLWVMDNHTNGVNAGYPTPSAMAADNDLATGRIIDQISHSKYWKDSAIFVVQDDSQNGIDHVDGHRAPAYVVSPYAKRGAVVNTYYSQDNITRTVEQILGIPPMNQLDMTAEPMYDVFTDKPNLTPYNVQPNEIPLNTMNPTAAQATSQMQKDWIAWSQKQDYRTEDELAFAPFNRMIWYASNGYKTPYPGDKTVLTPQQVLKKYPQTVVTNTDNDMPQTLALTPHSTRRR